MKVDKKATAKVLERLVSTIEKGSLNHHDTFQLAYEEAKELFGKEFCEPYYKRYLEALKQN